jgi:hypothetical protein
MYLNISNLSRIFDKHTMNISENTVQLIFKQCIQYETNYCNDAMCNILLNVSHFMKAVNAGTSLKS